MIHNKIFSFVRELLYTKLIFFWILFKFAMSQKIQYKDFKIKDDSFM